MLRHVYPAADIPVVQLSIDESKPASFHFEIGKKLAPLREESILIVGSGNLVHNLHTYAWGRHTLEAYDCAVKLELEARQMMLVVISSRSSTIISGGKETNSYLIWKRAEPNS